MGGVRKIGQEDVSHVPWQCKSQWSLVRNGVIGKRPRHGYGVGMRWLIKSAFSASKGDNKPKVYGGPNDI